MKKLSFTREMTRPVRSCDSFALVHSVKAEANLRITVVNYQLRNKKNSWIQDERIGISNLIFAFGTVVLESNGGALCKF